MPTLHLDVESRSLCDLSKIGSDKYWQDPTTELLCVAYAIDDSDVKALRPTDDLSELFEALEDPNITVHAWAAHFEYAALSRMNRDAFWPLPEIARLRCTQAQAAANAMPFSLGDTAMALRLGIQKDKEGRALMLRMSRPRTREPLTWWEDDERMQRLMSYCAQDVTVEREISKRLPALSDAEMLVWQADFRMNRLGIPLDVVSIKLALGILNEEKQAVNARLAELTEGRVTSVSQVAKLKQELNGLGCGVETLSRTEVSRQVDSADLSPRVRELLDIRLASAKSSTAKLEAMLAQVNSDGRARGNMQYHGATTGRWTGRGIQVQNLPRPVVAKEQKA
ncbi:MAG: hypothetical protein ACRCUB_07990, partial [Plesiomonas shigelloides]